ncbi:hypothetical protein PIB30_064675 [Stylosanthes scabra]|uniref:Uncharacterized protein n=1 Tax=Stylosanthes scabra TaxID=79078 RepID=A0ABU6TLJ5_9FABA|nr:hypothetical protein [Stylosanthes scabra]
MVDVDAKLVSNNWVDNWKSVPCCSGVAGHRSNCYTDYSIRGGADGGSDYGAMIEQDDGSIAALDSGWRSCLAEPRLTSAAQRWTAVQSMNPGITDRWLKFLPEVTFQNDAGRGEVIRASCKLAKARQKKVNDGPQNSVYSTVEDEDVL